MNTTRNDVLGIDVSKKKLDLALLINGKLKAKVFDNTSAGHRALVEWLRDSKASLATLHICMEATGVYYEAIARRSTLRDSRSAWLIQPVSRALDRARTSATRMTKSTLP
jgi:transposase